MLQTIDCTYFSSNLAFLLYFAGGKYEIDILSWLQIFSYGRTLETRTTFRDIKRIRPGTHLTIASDDIQEKQYWRLEYKPEIDLNPVRNDEKLFLEITDTIHSNPLLKEILDNRKCMQFLNNFKAGRISPHLTILMLNYWEV